MRAPIRFPTLRLGWKLPTARRLARGRAAAALLVIAVLTGFAVRLAIQLGSTPFMPDSCQILLLARSLAAGQGFQSGGTLHPDLSRPPLFPILIAAGSWITGDVESAAGLVIALAGALAVVPLFFLARHAFGPAAALAAVPLGVFSCLIGASTIILGTAPHLAFSVAAIAAAWIARSRDRRAWSFAAGLLAGASALTRAEGLVWAPFLAVAVAVRRGGSRSRRGPSLRRDRWPRGVARSGCLIAGFLLAYAPYVGWVSTRLGRFSPAPTIEYLQKTRDVADRLGLRYAGGDDVKWGDRALFLATADHRRRVLETYFDEGAMPEPDVIEDGLGTASTAAVVADDWSSRALRRLRISAVNLREAARVLRREHFLPVPLVTMGLIGVASAARSRRGRAGLGVLSGAGLVALAPVVSHVEARFLYVPFAVGLIVSAAGWGYLIRAADPRRRAVWWLLHAGIAAAVLIAGLQHVRPRPGYEKRFDLLQRVAADTRATLPAGPMLAVHPLLPYWADRPYRGIPLGGPATILDFARAQEATTLVVEGERDYSQRPDLRFLSSGAVPPGFSILLVRPNPGKGELRLFALDTTPSPADGATGERFAQGR